MWSAKKRSPRSSIAFTCFGRSSRQGASRSPGSEVAPLSKDALDVRILANASAEDVGGTSMLSVWVPKKEILLTPVGYVTFKTAGPKDDLVIVPWSAIAELAGAGAEPLDEKHLRLLPCSGPRGRPSWHVRRKSRSPQTP